MLEEYRLLKELLETEVYPALNRYIESGARTSAYVHQGEALELLVDVQSRIGISPLRVDTVVWVFNDHMAYTAMPERAKRIVGALGVSKDAFWCLVFAWAIYDGLRDYKVHHRGALPDDSAKYLYGMLTADDLAAEVKKDY